MRLSQAPNLFLAKYRVKFYAKSLNFQEMTDLLVYKHIPFTPNCLNYRKHMELSFEVSKPLQKASNHEVCSVYFSQTTLFEVSKYRVQCYQIAFCFHSWVVGWIVDSVSEHPKTVREIVQVIWRDKHRNLRLFDWNTL